MTRIHCIGDLLDNSLGTRPICDVHRPRRLGLLYTITVYFQRSGTIPIPLVIKRPKLSRNVNSSQKDDMERYSTLYLSVRQKHLPTTYSCKWTNLIEAGMRFRRINTVPTDDDKQT